jgi:phytanoyl-CoA dioxygenase PhyH
MMKLQTFSIETPFEEISSTLDRDGGVIVENVLQANELSSLRSDFQPFLDSAHWGNSDSAEPDDFFGRKTKRFHGLISKSAHMAGVLSKPLLQDMAENRLGIGERCFDVRVSTCELMTIGPGERQQSLHRDIDAWHFMPLEPPRPENLISANIALDDFTEENGATVVVPGSHKWPQDRRANESEMCQAIMKRGSALIYSGEIVHGGGANRSDRARTGLYVGLVSSWLRPSENHLQTNRPEDVYALPTNLQKMLNVIPTGFSLIC